MVKLIIKRILLGRFYSLLFDLPVGVIFINKIFKLIGINKSSDILINFTSVVSPYSNIFFNKDKITLTSFCVSGNCYIQAFNGIYIEKNFLFVQGLKLVSANHKLDDYS